MAARPRSQRNFRRSETESREHHAAVLLCGESLRCRDHCRRCRDARCIARHSRRATTQRADESASRQRHPRSIQLIAGRNRSARLRVNPKHRSLGTILLIIFFAAGSLICLVTMLALAFPGSFLESIWQLKPEARVQFLEIGRGASIAVMAVVGVACGSAAIGLGRDAEWGRRLAIGILSANLVGDSVNALLRHDPKTLVGLPIGGLMIWYLVKKRVSAEK